MRNSSPAIIPVNLVEKIVPKYRYDGKDTFDVWQKSARDKLSDLLGMNYMVSCDSNFQIEDSTPCDGYTKMRFTFMSEPGYYVPGYILKPDKFEGKLPIMLCLQGHSTGKHISIGEPKYPGDEEIINEGDRNYGQLSVKKGYFVVAIDQRYMGECGGDDKGPGCCANGRRGTASAMQTLLLGRTAIGERVWDVSRTIDVITKHFPEVDSDDITCTGNSGGGTTTFYAACYDTRIKYAMPSCSVCTYLDSIVRLYHCPCNYIPGITRYFDMGDLGGLIAPRKLIVVAGKNDPIFPISGVEKTMDLIKSLYKASGAEGNAALVVGPEGHRYYADIAFQKMDELRQK